GGRSSAYFAAKNPSRAAGLVLVDYSPDNAPAGSKRTAQTVAGTPEMFASIDEAMQYFKAGPEKRARFEAYLAPVAGGYAVKRDTHFRDQFRKVIETGERPKLGVDMWQVLAELRCPVLVTRGARSDMVAPETVARMQAANPRIRVVEVDAGHNVAGENPAGFLAAVNPFLASLKEASHEYARH
ncbi:MAG: alpha/beta hydrolase, partial [Burkholderiales bacterium]